MEKLRTRVCSLAMLVVLAVSGVSRGGEPIPGLVSHWRLDEGGASTAYDSVGTNHGTVYGARWVTGQVGGALYFNGSADYVRIPDSDSLDITGDLSIEAWVKTTQTSPWCTIFSNLLEVSPHNGYKLEMSCWESYNGQLRFYCQEGYLFSVGRVNTGAWTHVAVTLSGTTATIYIDGAPDSSGTVNVPRANSVDQSIGASYSPWYFFWGMIDEVAVFNRGLSAEEVQEHYENGLIPPRQLTGLEITGPNVVAEDFRTSYRAIAYYDDGSTEDVTGSANWWVEPAATASVEEGLMDTEDVGRVEQNLTIYAQYGEGDITVGAEKLVMVFPVCPRGSALEFDGVNDYVATALGIDQSRPSNVTMVAWVYPAATSPYKQQVISTDNGGYDLSVLKRHGTWRVFTGDGSWNTGFDVDVNRWQQIAAVFKAAEDVVFYKNGVSRSRGAGADTDISDNPVAIGDNPGRWDEHFEGKIDEVRVYDRALTAEEIWENMHRKLSGEEPNLVGYWDFDEGEGQIVYDLSGNSNHGWLGWTPFADSSDPAWVEAGAPMGDCGIPVVVHIKPGSCPNPVNVESRGVVPVAVLGSQDFDVAAIDAVSIQLAGVSAIRSSLGDVSTPVADGNECECNEEGPDGYTDLTLKFNTREIVQALGDVNDGDVLPLMLTGVLQDGTLIEGTDCIVIHGKFKPFNKGDLNKDGVVNVFDFAAMAENWLESTVVAD